MSMCPFHALEKQYCTSQKQRRRCMNKFIRLYFHPCIYPLECRTTLLGELPFSNLPNPFFLSLSTHPSPPTILPLYGAGGERPAEDVAPFTRL